MATTANHLVSAMLILALLTILSLDLTVAQVGVCYGRNGDSLPSPCAAVGLYDDYGIQQMRIYEPDVATLDALSGSNTELSTLSTVSTEQAQSDGSNIELAMGVPHRDDRNDLQFVASSQANADAWVQSYVRKYPRLRFKYIVVGNEIRPDNPGTAKYAPFVLPAMQNIYNAISAAGLADKIKVTTAVDTEVLAKSYPPEDGEFKPQVTGYLNPITQFLASTGAPLFVNVYPYFAFLDNQGRIDLNYALAQPNSGLVTSYGTRYDNLLFALVDAVYAAMERTGRKPPPKIVVGESGWSSGGGDGKVANVENARIYNANLIQAVKKGTPKRPGEALEAYIFAMFDENLKDGREDERHFGIFTADGQSKYPISFD